MPEDQDSDVEHDDRHSKRGKPRARFALFHSFSFLGRKWLESAAPCLAAMYTVIIAN